MQKENVVKTKIKPVIFTIVLVLFLSKSPFPLGSLSFSFLFSFSTEFHFLEQDIELMQWAAICSHIKHNNESMQKYFNSEIYKSLINSALTLLFPQSI